MDKIFKNKDYNKDFQSYVLRFAESLKIDTILMDEDNTKIDNFWFMFDIFNITYTLDKTILETFKEIFSMLDKDKDAMISLEGINNLVKENHNGSYKLAAIKYSLDKREFKDLTNVIYWEGHLFWYLMIPNKDKHYACYSTRTNKVTYHNDKSIKEYIYYFIKSRLFIDPMVYFDISPGEKQLRDLNSKITNVLKSHTFGIDDVGYKPSREILYFKDKQRLLNLFTAPPLYFHFEEKEAYVFPKIAEHLLYLCGNDKGAYIWFMKWLGWKIQNPERKIPTAILFRTVQGAGKGIVEEYIIMPIFGVENFRSIDNDALTKEWGGYLKNRQFIIANEVQFNFKRDYQNLKRIVSDSYLDIQVKGHENETIKNYTQFMFFSNMDNSIKIEEGDRRFTVVDQQKKQEKDYYTKLVALIPGELKDFVSYLKSLDIKYQDVSTAYDTEAKTSLQELHRHPVYGFIEDLRNIAGNITNAFEMYKPQLPRRPSPDGESITVEEFYQYWLGYCKINSVQGYHHLAKNKFSSKIKELGIASLVVRKGQNTIRIFPLDDIFIDHYESKELKASTYDNSIIGYTNAMSRVFTIMCPDSTESLSEDILHLELHKLGCNDLDLIKITLQEAITRGDIFEPVKGEYRSNL